MLMGFFLIKIFKLKIKPICFQNHFFLFTALISQLFYKHTSNEITFNIPVKIFIQLLQSVYFITMYTNKYNDSSINHTFFSIELPINIFIKLTFKFLLPMQCLIKEKLNCGLYAKLRCIIIGEIIYKC